MFNKLLIATRGEIACRIIRTARTLGIPTVAVYSTFDEHALHVKLADEAYHIGNAPLKDSYLNIEHILSVSHQVKADALHPGYGFLSENPEFVERCLDAGLTFIGPPPQAIRAMGLKYRAKALMSHYNIPTIPGYFGDDQSPDALFDAAKNIGFPLLIKASRGGGGKGIRLVTKPDAFMDTLKICQQEARTSFGDDHVILEKYLSNPRHIEVQIFADRYGNVVHLFERDCSIQRRHQKIIEESPAYHLSQSLRKKIGATAIQIAKAIKYHNAGTVEFLLDSDQHFYFMEMNTRLQVEHPVTEMITGLDLVAWQLQIAKGLPLPLEQSDITYQGHAIEVRICAEIPHKQFLPATGTITGLQLPELSSSVRLDSGVRIGDKVGTHYDPMLAKLIIWGKHRQKAIERLQNALNQFHMMGVANNLAFLRTIVHHPKFIQGNTNTHFIENHPETLLPLIETFDFDDTLAPEKLHLLTSPLPGILSKILVQPADIVSTGDTLLVLETMKTKHTIKAPYSAKISTLYYSVGDAVETGSELLALEPL